MIVGPVTKDLKIKPGKSKKMKLAAPAFGETLSAGNHFVLAEVTGATGTAPGVGATSAAVPVAARVVNVTGSFRSAVNLAPGQTSRAVLVLKNEGNVAVDAPVQVAVSAAPAAGGTATQLSPVTVSAKLKPGKSKAFRVVLTARQNLAAGSFALTPNVDPNDQLV